MKRFWHIPLLIGTFVAAVLIIQLLDPFYGMGTPMVAALLLGSLIATHGFLFIVGFFTKKASWKKVLIFSVVALSPALFLSVIEAKDAWYLHHKAVYDRFCDYLIQPIPESVTKLEFIPSEESGYDHLLFRFTISPYDLDKIISEKNFRKIETSDFRRPDDLFTHPEYLPMEEPISFYILNDVQSGYPDKGIGNGLTLKVSGDRRNVIFRYESAAYYLYKYWESENNQLMERDFLAQLKKKNELEH
jgi:hypothetical protein